MPDETVTINKDTLYTAFLHWEQENRRGECKTPEEIAALTPDQVARENVEHFWDRLHG